MERFPVVIVGGGPVGLSAAILLARHGIRCLLVERKASTTNHPKARAINVRTMELVRQWGIEDALCVHTLPQEFWRFIWCTTLTGAEIARVNDPSGEETDKSPSARRIVAQDAVEAVLYEKARSLPLVTLRFSTELQGFRQTDTGVVAELGSEGSHTSVEARYLVAADGAASDVRRTLGIAMEGPAALSHQASIYFRADLTPWMAHRPADIYYCTDGIWLAVVNGTTRWLGIMRYDPENGLRREDFTPAFCTEQIRRSVGVPDLPVEIINTSFWTMAAQVAARFSQGRVFLIGDAAHRMAPTGGFGLNTGVQDAHNLAWKLAAVLHGHAGPALLDTYEAERKPVAVSNAAWSAENAHRIWNIIAAAHAGDYDNIRLWAAEQQNHICSEGRALGFRYTSEAVAPDGTPEPAFSTQTYRPSARPGSRAPHCWLLQGATRRSTLDLFDHHFVLLTAAPGDPWRAAAQALDGPMRSYLKVFTIGPYGDLQDPTNNWLKLYDLDADGAVLVRPDGHVAWRSRRLVTDPAATLAEVMHRLLRPLVLA